MYLVANKNREPAMLNTFAERLQLLGYTLRKEKVTTLQINVGKRCNLNCVHCHVGAGAKKLKENMTFETAKSVVKLMDLMDISTVDLTGGSPELNPNFRFLVDEAKKRNLHIIDRCNPSIIFEPGLNYLPEFLAKNKVEIIASFPCYTLENVDKQRGKGTFKKSIDALILLNRLGYGRENSGLVLNLVYNPLGAFLPPPQNKLENAYKERLLNDFGIVFNSLYTITNMPISRYGKYLQKTNQYDKYTNLLKNSFNPNVIPNLMCRDIISVSWDGKIYDCDFNQMMGLQIEADTKATIYNISTDKLKNLAIKTEAHCFGCTAGAGSSCQGTLGET